MCPRVRARGAGRKRWPASAPVPGRFRDPADCLLLAAARRDDHRHLPSFHLRLHFNGAELIQVLPDPTHQVEPKILMKHLPPPEAKRDLRLVAAIQETLQIAQFHLIVGFFRSGTELHFLQLRLALPLALGTLLFLGFEDVLAVVHDPDDGRLRLGSHQDQVQLLGTRERQGVVFGNNAQLTAIHINQTNVACVDLVIDRGSLGTLGASLDVQFSTTLNGFTLKPPAGAILRGRAILGMQ